MSVERHLDWLGWSVKDKVSGFKGVVTSVCFDLYGCVMADVQPKINEKNETQRGLWLDVSRLIKVGKKPIMTVPNYIKFNAATAAGPSMKSPR